MLADLSFITKPNTTIAVAVSGGSDSMALLHFCNAQKKVYSFNLVAINVEHGIRGESSIADTNFVKNYCKQKDITFISYSVDSLKYAKEHKLSIEESARFLRYDAFDKAYKKGLFDYLLTAHHERDNVETVLFNMFRASALKGLGGIPTRSKYIVRPMLRTPKDEVDEYVKSNAVPFVTDETNHSNQYSRNFIRHNVLPEIKKLFPEVEKSISRLSQIAISEDDYLENQANKALKINNDTISISVQTHPVIFRRAIILALKNLGVKKDWTKTHVDSALCLIEKQNGARVDLLDDISAVREYDEITLYKKSNKTQPSLRFNIGEFEFLGAKYKIVSAPQEVDLKSGLFIDADKIPKTAIIRTKQDGDIFTKFGGGTKKLCDYLTDKKVPQRLRDSLPVIADGEKVLAIFTLATSNDVKVDATTKNVLQLLDWNK